MAHARNSRISAPAKFVKARFYAAPKGYLKAFPKAFRQGFPGAKLVCSFKKYFITFKGRPPVGFYLQDIDRWI
jgi:hypothetical protein